MTRVSDFALHGAVLVDAPALRELRDALSGLAELPGAASSIVQHPDWVLFELESRSDGTELHVVIVRDEAGTIVGYAPFLAAKTTTRIAMGKHAFPLHHGRTLRLLGAQAVAAPARRDEVERVIAQVIKDEPGARVVHLQEAELPSMLANRLTEGRAAFTCREANLLAQVKWIIEPQESLASYLAKMKSKSRKNLFRRVRNVYSTLGPETHLRIVETPEEVDEYCALMNQVYPRSWHADAQVIDWQLPARRELFRQLATRQQFIGHLLMLGGRPIAYVHGYRLGDRYLLDDIGYDEEFGKLGVGLALVFEAIQDLIERNPRQLVDFGYGDNQYKRVLGTRQTSCGSLYAVRGLWARACFNMITPLRWAYSVARRIQRKRDDATAED